jgi:hypothetical protein
VARAKIEQDLNEVIARAYQLCDSKDGQKAVARGTNTRFGTSTLPVAISKGDEIGAEQN